MDGLWTALCRIARVFAWIGGTMILLAALIVSAEVISRKLLRFPFSGSDEAAAYLFAIGTSWSMAYVLTTRGHVRIDALYGLFGPRVRALLDIVALIGLAILVAAITDRAWVLLLDNYGGWTKSNTPNQIPLAYPQAPWLLGFALFAFAIIVALLRSIGALIRGDFATASATIGVASQDEEIKGELEGLGIQTRAHREKA
jgi:TRAP-type C4-dicarboxylate transport system permease small subunit